MKKTFFNVKTAVTLALCFMLIFSLGGCAMNTESGSNDSNSQLTNADVQIIAMNSDTTDSSYQVEQLYPALLFLLSIRCLRTRLCRNGKLMTA